MSEESEAVSLTRESDLQRLSADTVLFFSSVEIDETWTRSTVLACVDAGLCVAVAIVGLQTSVEGLARVYRSRGIPVFCVKDIALRKANVSTVVTASSGVARSLFSDRLQHLVHMPHSLISFHMAYPPNAFDGYDMLFAAGPHHAAEFAALRAARGLPAGHLLPVGYGKLDLLVEAGRAHRSRADGVSHVLVAPSWGPTNILSVFGPELVTRLLAAAYRVTLRPHPSFYLGEQRLIAQLRAAGAGSALFSLENPNTENEAIHEADVLISDYSGAALEFAAYRRRPTVFVNVAKKVFNTEWSALGIEPVEVAMRSRLGVIVPADLDEVLAGLEQLGRAPDSFAASIAEAERQFLHRPPSCSARAAEALYSLNRC